jgi:L-threonylcarbamoyladenylate synthase
MGILDKYQSEIIRVLSSGGVVFMPTDTIPGLICLAKDKNAVEKIFKLKKREKNKPLTIVISKIEQLNILNVVLPKSLIYSKYWPGATSIVLKVNENSIKSQKYLHRGLNTLAIRLTSRKDLAKIIDQIGPIATSSANIQSEKPAENIYQAKKYFNEKIDLFIEPDYKANKPSRIIRINNDGSEIVLR